MKPFKTLAALGLCAFAVLPIASCTAAPQNTTQAATTDATNAVPLITSARILPRAGGAKALVGGKFQGSNTDATSGFVDLATIATAPLEGEFVSVKFDKPASYRFVRFFAPPDSYGGVAELQFYAGDTLVEGEKYGTFGSRDDNGNTFHKAFDGDAKTFFEAPLPNDQYLGIYFAAPEIQLPAAPADAQKSGYRHYHVGNSLTDTIGEFAQEIARSAGFENDMAARQTIPGAPLRVNWDNDGGFGTPYRKAFDELAPLDALVLQVFIPNGDNIDPSYSLKFYDAARVKSPDVQPFIYAQWPETGTGGNTGSSPNWEERNRAEMRVYLAHALDFARQRPDARVRIVPGGFALGKLRQAFENGQLPGLTGKDFFPTNFEDGLHVSMNGRYFIGLVHYVTFYGKNPVGLPRVELNDKKPTLTPEQMRVYQQVAWESVQEFERTQGAPLGLAIPAAIDARTSLGAKLNFRDPLVRYISKGSQYGYLLNAPQAGRYELRLRYKADQDRIMPVTVNYQAAGELALGASRELTESQPLALELQAGLNVVTLVVPEERPYEFEQLFVTRPGQALENTLPFLDLSAFFPEVNAGETYQLEFQSDDAETPTNELQLSATSASQALVPDANLKIESLGENRFRLHAQSVAGQTGQADITVTVTDKDGASRSVMVNLKVK